MRIAHVLILTGHQHPAHDWRGTTEALTKVLPVDSQIEVDVWEDPERISSDELPYDVILFNYMNWQRPGLSDRARQRFLDFVRGGHGLVAFHFSNGAFPEWPEFRNLARRVWVEGVSGHDPYGTFHVDIVDPDHPITRGMKSFDATDELYFNQVGDLPVHPIVTARSNVTGKDEPLAFVYQEGNGRVFQILLGHDAKAVRVEGTAELIRRGVIWAAKVESE